MGRLRRFRWVMVGVVIGMVVAGGIGWAVTVIPPSSTDRYSACVSPSGVVRSGTIRINATVAKCPAATDVIRSWNAQGPQGIAGPTGAPGDARFAALTVTTAGSTAGGIVEGSGITCRVDAPVRTCAVVLPLGTSVTLAATADDPRGAPLQGWSGPCTGTTLQCTFTLDGDTEVGANFAPPPQLDVTFSATLATEGGCTGGTYTFEWEIRNKKKVAAGDATFIFPIGFDQQVRGTGFTPVASGVVTSEGEVVASSTDGSINVSLGTIAPDGAVQIQMPVIDEIGSEDGSCATAYATGQVSATSFAPTSRVFGIDHGTVRG